MPHQTSFLKSFPAVSPQSIRDRFCDATDLPAWNRCALAIAGIVCLGCLALTVDAWVARLFASDIMPGELRAICHRAEVFGHSYGVLAIVITIWLLDEPRRRLLPRLVAMTVLTGLAADFVKILVWRMRPFAFDLNHNISESFIGSVFTSHHVDFNRAISDSAQHSFPSAHTAMAVSLAFMLGRMYPAAQTWFWVLTSFVAANRIDGGAHFPSDVLFGAALGLLVSVACLRSNLLDRWLARWEKPENRGRTSGFPA